MKKEYLSPEIQVVKVSLITNMLSSSTTIDNPGGSGVPLTKEENGSTNTTVGGGSIWDNEW